MEKEKLQDWNRLVYVVSEVFARTHKLKTGPSLELGNRIRKAAIGISSSVNALPGILEESDFAKVYLILSAISVLEVYLEIAKKNRFLRNTEELDKRLSEVKRVLDRLISG